jgi:oxygen-dependent protoporphyrinogen oxidase
VTLASRTTGTDSRNVRTILVIGGGFAGVSAAALLLREGFAVTLLESRETLGGRARSDVLAGAQLDVGAQLITTGFARTLELLAPARAQLRTTGGRDVVVRDGARLPVHFGSVRSLMGFQGLSTMEKLRLGATLLPTLARHGSQLDAGGERVPRSLDTQNARGYVTTHVSASAARLLVDSTLNAFYATEGDEASLAFFLALGRYGSDGDLLVPQRGWSATLETCIPTATIVANARIAQLDSTEQGVVATDDGGRQWRGSAAILAVDAATTVSLMGPLLSPEHPLLEMLGAIRTRATWTLALRTRTALPRDAFGVFGDTTTASDAGTVSTCAVRGAVLPEATPDGDILLAWPTPRFARTAATRDSIEIVNAMVPDVERLVPGVASQVTRARVYRFDPGTPLAYPGFADDRARLRALAVALPAQLASPVALAGDHLTMPLIEGAVASGSSAARHIIDALARSPTSHSPS